MRLTKLDLTDDERRDGLTCVVLLLGGLDELLLAVPAIRALRAELPRHGIVLAGHPGVGRAAVSWRIVDRWLPARAWHMPRLADLDVAVNLTDAGPQSHRLLLHQRPRRLVAAANPELGVAGPHWSLREGGDRALTEHRAARWCRIVAASFQIDVDPRDGLLVRTEGTTRAEAVLHPGGPPALRWPADRFAEVAAVLRRRGLQVRVLCLPGEADAAASVVETAGLPDAVVWEPRSVAELTAGIGSARLVVAGDTVPGHLAGSLAVPGVHLYGRTNPRERGPLTVARRHRSLYRPQGVPAGVDPILGISVEDVTSALAEILDGVVPPGDRAVVPRSRAAALVPR